MTFYLSIILDLQNFFHWYILQSWKLKRPQIQLRPHHLWTFTSDLTTVVNSVLKFMINFNFKIINFPNMCSNIPASPAYGVYISQLIRSARASNNYSDFLKRHLHLRNRLLKDSPYSISYKVYNPIPRSCRNIFRLCRDDNKRSIFI